MILGSFLSHFAACEHKPQEFASEVWLISDGLGSFMRWAAVSSVSGLVARRPQAVPQCKSDLSLCLAITCSEKVQNYRNLCYFIKSASARLDQPFISLESKKPDACTVTAEMFATYFQARSFVMDCTSTIHLTSRYATCSNGTG